MSDVETEHKREEEQRRKEDERLDTAEDERRPEDATEEVRRATPIIARSPDLSDMRDDCAPLTKCDLLVAIED